jgi:predicted transcriptional regulator
MAEIEDLKARNERLSLGSRITELDRLLGTVEHELPEANDRLHVALGVLVTDAILDWDEAALDFAMGQLQRIAALAADYPPALGARVEGRMLGLIDVVHAGIQRVLPMDLMGQFVEPESHSHRFLKEIDHGSRMSNTALAAALGVDETEASRIGRRLIQAGLARKQKLGRTNQWLITPRGVQVVAVLDEGGVIRPTREHRQLQT